MQENTQETEVKKVKKTIVRKTCPKRYSNFFITINSNKNVNNMTEEEKTKFLKVVDNFFNVEIDNFIILKGSKAAVEFGMPIEATREELIKRIVGEIKIEYKQEIAPNTQKLHIHGIVGIAKRGVDTSLDYNSIREYFSKELGYAIHFHVILYRDAKQNLLDYISKSTQQIPNLDK